jgi:PAS domain S-box-containing protein
MYCRENKDRPLALVVDDDASLREVLRDLLEDSGLQVEEADSGSRALALIEVLRPDIVLLDVMMPEMDGYATLSRVRRLPKWECLPVLMMSGRDDTETVNRAYEAGATDFIAKPIHSMALVHRVRAILETRRMAEQIRKSELMVQALIDTMPALLFRISRDGFVFDFKVARKFQTFVSHQEYLGKNVNEVMASNRAECFIDYVQQALQHQDLQTFENQPGLSGELSDCEAHALASGEDEAMVIVRDNTSQRRLEEDWLRLHRVVREASESILLFDLEGTIVEANDAACKLLGIDQKNKLIGQRLIDFIAAEDRHKTRGAIYRGPENGSMVARDVRVITEVDTIAVKMNIGMTRNQSGTPTGLFCTLTDVGEQRDKSEGLCESSEFFRSLVENSSEMVVVFDADGTLKHDSPSARKLLGENLKNGSGRDWSKCVHPNDLEAVINAFVDTIQNADVSRSFEFRVRNPKGAWHVLKTTSRSLLADPAVAGIVFHCSDMMEKEDTDERAAQAKRKTTAAESAKSGYLTQVSYQVREPLHVIISYTDVLLDEMMGSLTPKQAEGVRCMRRNAYNVLALLSFLPERLSSF